MSLQLFGLLHDYLANSAVRVRHVTLLFGLCGRHGCVSASVVVRLVT